MYIFDVLMFKEYTQFVLEYCPTVWNLHTRARQYSSLSDQLQNVQRGSTSCVFCLCKFDANDIYLQIHDCHHLQSLSIRAVTLLSTTFNEDPNYHLEKFCEST